MSSNLKYDSARKKFKSVQTTALQAETLTHAGSSLVFSGVLETSATSFIRMLNHTANADMAALRMVNNAGSDNLILGWASNAYTTGGGIGWVENNKGLLYTAGSTFRIGSGTGSTFALETGANEIGAGVAVSTTTFLNTGACVAGKSSLRVPHGTAPSSPVNGDIWTTTAGLYVQINGSTIGPLS